MFNVCPGCGNYDAARIVLADEDVAICRHCGHRQPFRRLPLFVLTGASGAGKSAVALLLPALLPECVVLDSDILWRQEFATPDDGYQSFRELWLRLAKNIHQSGRPVVLGGAAVPEQFERCVERRYLAQIHYLALVCEPAILAARLRSRPDWRQSSEPQTIERMLAFNRWLREHAAHTAPPMTLLDTSTGGPQQTAEAAARWVRERLR